MNNDTSMSPADFAAMANNGDFGGNGALWCFLIIILFFCNGGNWGRQQNSVLDSTLAASAAQGGYVTSSQLNDQLRLQELQNGQRNIIDANAATEQRITATLSGIAANQAAYGQQQQTCCSEIKASSTANAQKILDAIQGNRMADMQSQINQLQMQNAMNGVVRYPVQTTYSSGQNPFCGCGCAQG